MDVLPTELWHNISELVDIGTIFSLYEALPSHDLRSFVASQVPNTLYTSLIGGRHQWKLSYRTSEGYEIRRKEQGKTEIPKRRDYGSCLIEDDLISREVKYSGDGKQAHIYFEYLQQELSPREATQNGMRFQHRTLSENPRPPLIRLKEYTASDSEERVYGTTFAEVRLSTTEFGAMVILRYRLVRGSTTSWDFFDPCTSKLEICGIGYQFGSRSWTYKSLPKKWFEQMGLHILLVRSSEGQEDGYARSRPKAWDAIEFGTWPGIKEDDPGLIVGRLTLSFKDVWIPSAEKRDNDEIWGDDLWV